MKIKHWQGYGCVNAKKISKTANKLVVEVRGEHEYGLATNDKCFVFDWLVKRFDKSRKDWWEIAELKVDETSHPKADNFSGWEDVVTYTIKFSENPDWGL